MNLPPMPGLPRQEERTITATAFLGLALAFLSMGHKCHWRYYTKSCKWARIHLDGNRLLHQVGRSFILQKYYPGSSSSIHQEKHHISLWCPGRVHNR